MDIHVISIAYSQGTSYARGTTIDAYLSPEINEALYATWEKQKTWPEPLGFRGGVKGLTCEMVLALEEGQLTQALIKDYGKRKGNAYAKEILDAAARNAGR